MMTILAALAFAAQVTESDCPMRPPPLNVQHIQSSHEVKSFVVDPNNLAGTALLKDGSVLRVTNMGCQHSGSYVRLWMPGPRPADTDTKAWLSKAKLAADIGFDPVEAKFFDKWLATAKTDSDGQGGFTAAGNSGEGEITYEVIVEQRDLDIGTLVTVSYAYP
jgi:hypothetical protein